MQFARENTGNAFKCLAEITATRKPDIVRHLCHGVTGCDKEQFCLLHPLLLHKIVNCCTE